MLSSLRDKSEGSSYSLSEEDMLLGNHSSHHLSFTVHLHITNLGQVQDRQHLSILSADIQLQLIHYSKYITQRRLVLDGR